MTAGIKTDLSKDMVWGNINNSFGNFLLDIILVISISSTNTLARDTNSSQLDGLGRLLLSAFPFLSSPRELVTTRISECPSSAESTSGTLLLI